MDMNTNNNNMNTTSNNINTNNNMNTTSNNMNIDDVLSNPTEYGFTRSNYTFNNNEEINNLTSIFNNLDVKNNNELELDVESRLDIDEDQEPELENKVNPLYNKFVPIEVANYFCRQYFDDEDFIYMTFELPNELLDDIIHTDTKTVSEYFHNEIENYKHNIKSNIDEIYYNLYSNCISIYDKILEYYLPNWYSSDCPHDNSDYTKFDKEWTHKCRILLDNIKYVLNTGMTDESISYLCTYNKEVYMGLFIIMPLIFDNE